MNGKEETETELPLNEFMKQKQKCPRKVIGHAQAPNQESLMQL